MGLTHESAQFFRHLRAEGVGFRETLTVGRQSIYMDATKYAAHLAALHAPEPRETVHADEFFRALGAENLEFADHSAYEGATLLHDFNRPLPVDLKRRFDCVFDGGSLEHVFNFPQAFKNCMELTKVGGHLIISTPANNFCGHGFYQFSPELFFRALTPEQGFVVEVMATNSAGRWYSVADPASIQTRVELITRRPILLFICARRVAEIEPFTVWPKQSDYVAMWDATSKTAESAAKKSAKERLLENSAFLRRLQFHWQNWKQVREYSLSNGKFFTPLQLRS